MTPWYACGQTPGADVCFCMSLCENPTVPAKHCTIPARLWGRIGWGGSEGADRRQTTLLPDTIEDYVGEENPVRVINAFIDMLDLAAFGFNGVIPEETGRPRYHPATLLKIYVSGYLLERECHRNLELIWLTGRLAPDFKLTYRMTTTEAGKVMHRYWTNVCEGCALKQHCTTSKQRRIARWSMKTCWSVRKSDWTAGPMR